MFYSADLLENCKASVEGRCYIRHFCGARQELISQATQATQIKLDESLQITIFRK